MFGTTELVIIAFIVVLLFGVKKLPQLGKSMGSAITNFKKGLNEADTEEEKKDNSENDQNKSIK